MIISEDREIIRVRVWFIKTGDRFTLSEIDEALSPVKLDGEQHVIVAEELLQDGYLKLAKNELAESLGGSFFCSSPNDPVVESARNITAIFFDLLELDHDWGGKGGMGWNVEQCGMEDTFKDYLDALAEYAWKLIEKNPENYRGNERSGIKANFLTMWAYSTSKDYWGEYDYDYDLIGCFSNYDVKVYPLTHIPVKQQKLEHPF